MPTTQFDVTAFGETMLRYSVPSGERITKLKTLDVHVGGAETNVLSALSSVGRNCGWVSALPDNDLGSLVLRELSAASIDTSAVNIQGDRVGTYYVEFAAAPRPINVIYDRARASVTELTPTDINWDYLLNTKILHITGITAALSKGCYDILLEACERAKDKDVAVCFDVNYRTKLWSPEVAQTKLLPILKGVDLLICGEGDAETVFGVKGSAKEVLEALYEVSSAKHVVLTQSSRGSSTLVDGVVVGVEARAAEIIDRLGAGDAFAGGVIDGYLDGDVVEGMKRGSVLSALALTQHGDMITTSRNELNTLMTQPQSSLSR